jgi:pectate lyase
MEKGRKRGKGLNRRTPRAGSVAFPVCGFGALAVAASLCSGQFVFAAPPPAADQPIGYATVGGAITGGAGGPVVTVTNSADLMRLADSNGPCIIQVSGTLPISGMDTHVRANKTIIGLGTNATLVGDL